MDRRETKEYWQNIAYQAFERLKKKDIEIWQLNHSIRMLTNTLNEKEKEIQRLRSDTIIFGK